jgi:hypothetical protein
VGATPVAERRPSPSDLGANSRPNCGASIGIGDSWQDRGMQAHIRDLQRAFDEAEANADIKTLNKLLADDFRSIGEQGYVLDKQQWIGKFADVHYTSIESSEVDVCFYGTTAIVRCLQRSQSSWRDNEMFLTVRVGQVWVQLAEGWKLAGIQFSSVSEA